MSELGRKYGLLIDGFDWLEMFSPGITAQSEEIDRRSQAYQRLLDAERAGESPAVVQQLVEEMRRLEQVN
ncbi:MAG TPA: hypothetical protein VNH65_03215 [Candidatus Acidoferrum sp.]|nr:hypothetical protein [Candidatus Acidoferrum sp.]